MSVMSSVPRFLQEIVCGPPGAASFRPRNPFNGTRTPHACRAGLIMVPPIATNSQEIPCDPLSDGDSPAWRVCCSC